MCFKKTYMYIKLCENTKNCKYAYPGSNKVVYGDCEQESEEKMLIKKFCNHLFRYFQ